MKNFTGTLILFSFSLLIIKLNCNPLIDIFFTPRVDYEEIYKEKRSGMHHELKLFTRNICIKMDDVETKQMVKELTCLEHNFSQYMSSMVSIWWQATGTDYP